MSKLAKHKKETYRTQKFLTTQGPRICLMSKLAKHKKETYINIQFIGMCTFQIKI